MARRKTTELDMAFAARVPMLAALVEYRGGHSIRPRFCIDEDIVGWSVYDGERLIRGFGTKKQARQFVAQRSDEQRREPPTPKFLNDAYVQSFAA